MTATFVVDCINPYNRLLVEALAGFNTNLSNELIDVTKTFPGGVEEKTISYHRLNDYFENIEIKEQNESAFLLIFHPRETADRYWRDLMVQTLRSITVDEVIIKPLHNDASQ